MDTFKQFLEENKKKALRPHQYMEMISKLTRRLEKEKDVSDQLVILGEVIRIQTQIQLYGTL